MTAIDPATGLAQGSFGIGTFSAGTNPFPALVRPDGDVLDLSRLYADTHAVFDDWERAFDRLHDLAANGASAGLRFESLRALPPLAHPNLLCAGANYRQHVAEMMTYNRFNQHNRRPDETDGDFFRRNLEIIETRARDGMPFFFTGLHSSLAGAHSDIVLPRVGEQHDWELELAIVIGKATRYASPDEAQSFVAGYCIVNDLGSVDTFRRPDLHWGYDWVGKHQPGFKPAGPFIVPAPFVRLNDAVRIRLSVNGAVKQDWPVTDMIFTPGQILSYASERVRLMPGDMLLTGSPPGNGASHGQFLKSDDLVEGEITGLGRQRNRCVAEAEDLPAARWRLRGRYVTP
jgi:2-keto-4-pentenoate hydratase/2-oxohepta-3-ene-1,7-dioic acid hydratase in catechol pathway